jgi:ABC-2 type transport system permease protein
VSDLPLVAHQIRYEQKAYWRNPAGAFFTFAFPLMFLVIFASLNRGARIAELGGISYNQYYIPAIIAFGIMSACYTNLGIALVNRRETGILKRLRSTPLPSWAMFSGLIGSALVVGLITSAITLTAGMVLYGVHAPYRWAELALALLVGAACFSALGVAVSTLVPNADAAPAIVNFPFFLLVFLGGVFFPLPPGSVLARLSAWFPVGPFKDAVFAAFNPLPTAAHWPWADLRVVAIWALAAGFLAVRRFRWEPRLRG